MTATTNPTQPVLTAEGQRLADVLLETEAMMPDDLSYPEQIVSLNRAAEALSPQGAEVVGLREALKAAVSDALYKNQFEDDWRELVDPVVEVILPLAAQPVPAGDARLREAVRQQAYETILLWDDGAPSMAEADAEDQRAAEQAEKIADAVVGFLASPQPAVEVPVAAGVGLEAYLTRQWGWSKDTFGPALRTKGIIQHITKELREIEAKPHDLSEWVDVIILAMDGFWRHGGKPEALLPTMQAKQDKNFARAWPDWRTISEDSAIEHDRSGEASLTPPADPKTPDAGVGGDHTRKAVARAMDEDGGWWKSCSGCHETNEGHETGHYSYSELFRCHVGAGCSECGGLGVVWEYFSDEAFAAMAEEPAQPAPAGDDETGVREEEENLLNRLDLAAVALEECGAEHCANDVRDAMHAIECSFTAEDLDARVSERTRELKSHAVGLQQALESSNQAFAVVLPFAQADRRRAALAQPARAGDDETGVREAAKDERYANVALGEMIAVAEATDWPFEYRSMVDRWQAILQPALGHHDGFSSRLATQQPKAETPAGVGEPAAWLWSQLMDWCKKRHFPPGDYSDLFSIVGRLRALSTAPATRPGGGVERVRHVKRGTEYEVLGEAEAQVSEGQVVYANVTGGGYIVRETKDGDKLTVYRDPKSGKLWCRFTDEMNDGRFVPAAAPAADGGVA